MRNKLEKLVMLFVVAGLMTGSSVAFAEVQEKGAEPGPGVQASGPGEGLGGGRGLGPKAFFKELGLNQEQQEKLEAHRKAQWAQNKEVREQMKAKMKALHEEMGKPDMDKTQVKGLVDEINTLKGHLFAQHIDGILEMKEVLTPEQFAKMQAHFEERGPGKHGKWGKREGGPEGEGPEGDLPPPEKD